jgi:hypothetical protein
MEQPTMKKPLVTYSVYWYSNGEFAGQSNISRSGVIGMVREMTNSRQGFDAIRIWHYANHEDDQRRLDVFKSGTTMLSTT